MTQEQMLALAVDQAWRRLQQAYELETLVYEQTPAIDLFLDDLDRLKFLTRHIVECERIWRRASVDLDKCRKTMAAEAEAQAQSQVEVADLAGEAQAEVAQAAAGPASSQLDRHQPLHARVASAFAEDFDPGPAYAYDSPAAHARASIANAGATSGTPQ